MAKVKFLVLYPNPRHNLVYTCHDPTQSSLYRLKQPQLNQLNHPKVLLFQNLACGIYHL